MNVEHISSFGVTIGGGFLGGILIGYALKKVVKIVAVVLGLLFAGFAYLQCLQVIDIKWAKLVIISNSHKMLL
ncbi:MAG TPA: FUN14 domain-containing protein [Candidatus Nitrosopolaris sp.]|nr:FUN14 domain-containing protein [Candidatus Nitrosopolaris sp.]